MIEFYPDPNLNAAANRIKTQIDEVIEAVMAIGNKTHSRLNIMMNQYMTDGVHFALNFLIKIRPDVDLLKGGVGTNDELFVQINDGVCAVVAGSCRAYCNKINLMLADKEGFKRDAGLVERTGDLIDEAFRLFSHLEQTSLSDEGEQNRVMNLAILKQVKRNYDSTIKKSWWS